MTEWATSVRFTVTIPSADSDDTFNAALDELTAKARACGDGADFFALAVDAIKNTRAQAMHAGRDNPYAIDRLLLRTIQNYIQQLPPATNAHRYAWALEDRSQFNVHSESCREPATDW